MRSKRGELRRNCSVLFGSVASLALLGGPAPGNDLNEEQKTALQNRLEMLKERLQQFEDRKRLEAAQGDLSPFSHPSIDRVRSSFEPVWLGGATGWGAKPPNERSAPSRCIVGSLSVA